MSNRFRSSNRSLRQTFTRVERAVPAAVVLAGISFSTIALLCPSMASAEVAEVEAEATEASEEAADQSSVVVAQAPSASAADNALITPIPDIATESGSEPSDESVESKTSDEEERSAEQFGEALSRVAESIPSTTPSDAPTFQPPPVTSSTKAARRNPVARAGIARDAIPHAPAKFNGIQVGKSTRTELVAAWGEPAESIDAGQGAVMTYRTEPFAGVEVLINSDQIVAAIKIALARELDPKHLTKQLSLEKFVSVSVTDENGEPLGVAFPERGVVFMFSPTGDQLTTVASAYSPLVSHVAIQPLDSRAFALRAEKRPESQYEQRIDDLKTALALDPAFAHAHWQLAEIYLATGQADLAEVESSEAVALEPENSAFKLRKAQALVMLAEYDDAVYLVREVLDSPATPSLVQAQALHEMARLASLGDAQIASKAIGFEEKAIALADSLATSSNETERRAAKQLLVEAHLSIAEEIARQSFGKKLQSISQWIGRASGIAESYIAEDGGSVELRLLVAQRALAAIASFKPTVDPTPWVTEAEEAAKELAAQSNDELWQQKLQWELGIAYYNALRVEHLRRETTAALGYGQQAIEHLASGAVSRQAVHASEQLVGQLYFQVGAVHAVHKQNHEEAAEWYDKAAPLLTAPRPVSELYSPRREGEVLVSIGVTYWQTNRQSRALDLSRTGTELVELAVDDGILAKSSLAVPYGNLATMYQQLGETTSAAKYAELAKSVSGTNSAVAARTSSPQRRSGQAMQTNAQLRHATLPRRR